MQNAQAIAKVFLVQFERHYGMRKYLIRKKNELLPITSCVMSVSLKRKKNELLSIILCVMSESSEKE